MRAIAGLAACLVALGGCGTGADDEQFLRSARLIVQHTAMNDLSDVQLLDYAKAICSDLQKADAPNDVALHDLLSLVDSTGGVHSGEAGWFTFRATETYCPEFSELEAITSFKSELETR